MARKKKDESKKLDQRQQDLQFDDHHDSNVKTCSIEKTLEELLFINVDYKDVNKLKKLRKINRRKQIELIRNLKDCIKEAL